MIVQGHKVIENEKPWEDSLLMLSEPQLL